MVIILNISWPILLAVQIITSKAFLIGEPCKYDEDCFVEHSYCEMQQICQCKENFIETEDRETCIAMVGAYCHSKYDCTSLPNSICKEDRCVCDLGYVPDLQNSKCMPVIRQLEGLCEHDIQCKGGLGHNSQCLRGKGQCICNPGYHFVQSAGICLENKGLGLICSNSSECYIGDDFTHTITCRGGHCACQDGYYEHERHCISGSAKDFTLPSALLLLCSTLILLNNKILT